MALYILDLPPLSFLAFAFDILFSAATTAPFDTFISPIISLCLHITNFLAKSLNCLAPFCPPLLGAWSSPCGNQSIYLSALSHSSSFPVASRILCTSFHAFVHSSYSELGMNSTVYSPIGILAHSCTVKLSIISHPPNSCASGCVLLRLGVSGYYLPSASPPFAVDSVRLRSAWPPSLVDGLTS